MSAPLPEERIKQIASLSEHVTKHVGNPRLCSTCNSFFREVLQDIPDLLQEVQRLKDENAKLKEVVVRRSGASSWEEFIGTWDPTEESAVDAIRRLKAELALAHGRVRVLEDAVLKASVYICESSSIDDKAAMKVFGKVMEEAAMNRLGV